MGWRVSWRVCMPLARRGVIAGLILAWMRALGEFGATVVLAYHPYTIPVYTFVQLSSTGVAGALPLALFSLGLSVIVIGGVVVGQRRKRKTIVVSLFDHRPEKFGKSFPRRVGAHQKRTTRGRRCPL